MFRTGEQVIVVDKESSFYGFKGAVTGITPHGNYNINGDIPADQQPASQLPGFEDVNVTAFGGVFEENELAPLSAS